MKSPGLCKRKLILNKLLNDISLEQYFFWILQSQILISTEILTKYLERTDLDYSNLCKNKFARAIRRYFAEIHQTAKFCNCKWPSKAQLVALKEFVTDILTNLETKTLSWLVHSLYIFMSNNLSRQDLTIHVKKNH